MPAQPVAAPTPPFAPTPFPGPAVAPAAQPVALEVEAQFQLSDNVLQVRYRARNASPMTINVFNLCYRQQLTDGRFLVDPNFAYCRVDAFGSAVLYKAVPEIPAGLKPEMPVVPCVSELVPGAMVQEEFLVAVPLTIFEGYPVWLGEFLPPYAQSVAFALGYFDPRLAPGTQLYTVQTPTGPARWPYPFAAQLQQVAMSTPVRLVAPIGGLPADVVAVRLQGAPVMPSPQQMPWSMPQQPVAQTVAPQWPQAQPASPQWPQAQPAWTPSPPQWSATSPPAAAAPPAPVAPAQPGLAPAAPGQPLLPSAPITTLGPYTVDRREKSSTGIDANLIAAGSYVLGFISGIAVFFIEKQSRFVRYHALQSTIVSLVLVFLLPIVSGFVLTALPSALAGTLGTVLGLAPLAIQLYLAYRAYLWDLFPVPIVGSIAAKQLEKPPGG